MCKLSNYCSQKWLSVTRGNPISNGSSFHKTMITHGHDGFYTYFFIPRVTGDICLSISVRLSFRPSALFPTFPQAIFPISFIDLKFHIIILHVDIFRCATLNYEELLGLAFWAPCALWSIRFLRLFIGSFSNFIIMIVQILKCATP